MHQLIERKNILHTCVEKGKPDSPNLSPHVAFTFEISTVGSINEGKL